MNRFLLSLVSFLVLSVASASLLDVADSKNEETISVEAVDEKTAMRVRSRSLQTFTMAPTRKQEPTNTPTRKPTMKPSQRGTLAPNMSGPIEKCIIPDKTVYKCGEPIQLTFNMAYFSPRQAPHDDDRIAIYPCSVKVYYDAEIWQWTCGDTPRNPDKCILPRSRGVATFDSKPWYTGSKVVWPVAPFKRNNGSINRCFKAVIIFDDGKPYTGYCESASFTINENDTKGCSVRNSSPSIP